MPDQLSTGESHPRRRGGIVAAGVLLAALAFVVLYTSRSAFSSPLALVVVAAIGLAALLLQRRFQPNPSAVPAKARGKSQLWLNGLGVAFAVAAVFADVAHFGAILVSIAALAAVISFAGSGLLILNTLRKRR